MVVASNRCCLTGLEVLQWEGRKVRPENGPILVMVSTVHTQLDLAVCGFGACAVANGATFCFCFPRTSLREATQAAQILEGSALRVLPLAMIQHFNDPGPDQVEGPTLSSNTRGNNCWKGNCYHWVTSAESWLLWKLLPQTLEPRQGEEIREGEVEWGKPCLKVGNWVSFPVLGALGKASNFPLPPFSYMLDVQSNLITGWFWGVIIEVEELKK